MVKEASIFGKGLATIVGFDVIGDRNCSAAPFLWPTFSPPKFRIEFFKGVLRSGWGILETSVKGLATLAIGEATPEAATALKTRFREMPASEGAPPAEVRARAAANLARSANQLRHLDAVHSIDRTLAQQDHSTVRALLLEMADVLAVEPPPHQRSDNGNPE
ncbi:MAG: hypothetical protein ACREPY_02925 [Rhodanobacteraceae bacterium]